MGIGFNTRVIYVCILFALKLADPSMSTGFTEFASGTYQINWTTLLTAAIGGIAGLVVAYAASDVMTGIVTALATVLTGWIIIPTSFMVGAPPVLVTFVTTLLALIWGWAMISFVRGFEG